MSDRVCRHKTEAAMLRCSVCAFGPVKPKPRRRRPTDSERLTWLLKTLEYVHYSRSEIDRLMREEARRG